MNKTLKHCVKWNKLDIREQIVYDYTYMKYLEQTSSLRHSRLEITKDWVERGMESYSYQIKSDQSLSLVRLFTTPWIAARQASLSITNSRSSLRLTSIKLLMPSSHLILCCPLLLLPPIPPSIRVLPMSQLSAWGGQSIEVSALASFPPKKSQGWSPSEWTGWISLQSKGLSRVFSNTTVQKHQFFSAQPSSQSNSHIHTWPQEKP